MKRHTLLLEKKIIWAFVLLGPIGNLIPVPGVQSFRIFYLMIPTGLILFLFSKAKKLRHLSFNICMSLPFFLYSFAGSLNAFHIEKGRSLGGPQVRFLLFYLLYMFTLILSSYISDLSRKDFYRLVKLYLSGYFVSVVCGYIFFIGFKAGVLSASQIRPFHILLQTGYGLLRFSPGSYPNEYGNVTSFTLSVLTAIIVSKASNILPSSRDKSIDTKEGSGIIRLFEKWTDFMLSKPFIYIFYLVTLIALFLTTTRAAYLSYIVTLLYLALADAKTIRDKIIRVSLISLFFVLVLFVANQFYDVNSIFVTGFDAARTGEGSIESRFSAWTEVKQYFESGREVFGLGFGATGTYLHSNYLQILYETGYLGLILFVVALLPVFINAFRIASNREEYYLFKWVALSSLFHVFSFGFSNHSFNHHLTWFSLSMFMIYTARARVEKPKESEAFNA